MYLLKEQIRISPLPFYPWLPHEFMALGQNDKVGPHDDGRDDGTVFPAVVMYWEGHYKRSKISPCRLLSFFTPVDQQYW